MDTKLLTIIDTEELIDEGNGELVRTLDAAVRSILKWCITLLDHRLDRGGGEEFQNAVINGLAILGMRDDGGGRHPGHLLECCPL